MNYPLYIGIILIIGLIGGKIASRVKLPSVTGYILIGLVLGPSITNIITKELIQSVQFINQLALGILAISIGMELHRYVFRKFGRTLLIVALGEGVLTFAIVSTFIYLLGMPISVSLVLGVLAMTVSPSTVMSILKEYKTKGKFSKNLAALVAIENLNCIVVFAVVTAILLAFKNAHITGFAVAILIIKEIGLAVAIGAISGLILATIIKKRPSNNKFLVLLLGVILVNTGIAQMLGLAALLLNMTTGAVITNLINRKQIMKAALNMVELPIFVAFLTLAGAKLDLSILLSIGLTEVAYIIGRLSGKIGGTYIFSKFTDLPNVTRNNIGLALTPQAGVVIGLSVIAEQKFPEMTGVITGIVLTGVIFFEVVGPLLLKRALINTKEIS
ncbi:MAG: cation:proton antiporter [Clostridiales bacterium]|nr:cation:proton antiporter [Clostridiales bacterium]